MTSPVAPEPPEHITWRAEFSSWPESKLRLFSEPSPTSTGYDERKAFARAILAELSGAKRDALEAKTLEIAERAVELSEAANTIAADALANSKRANTIATNAMICAAIATIIAAIIGGIIGSLIK